MEKIDILIDKERFVQTPDDAKHKIGDFFGFWQNVEIKRSIDCYSEASFEAPFEPNRPEFRRTFRPFTFKPMKVLHELKPLFVGTLVDIRPDLTPSSRTVCVSGYALPGVLQDCHSPAPSSEKPFEFKNVGFRAICETLCAPFGISVDFQADEGAPFEKVKLEIDKEIQSFLVELAKQRNLVLSNTRDGKLLCWRSIDVGKPVCHFTAGKLPLSNISASFSPQDYFSELTGFAQKKKHKQSARATQLNPWLRDILRPHSFKLDDTDRGDAPEATRVKIAKMFAGMASFDITDIPTWRDPQGDMWEPNTTITLLAPDVMCYRRTELLVREVCLKQDANGESASLNVVLPGAYSGVIPTELPWDEP